MTNFYFFSVFVNIFGVLPLQNAWFSGCILTKLTNILFFVKSVNVFGKYVDKIDTFLKICQICQPRCRTPPKAKGVSHILLTNSLKIRFFVTHRLCEHRRYALPLPSILSLGVYGHYTMTIPPKIQSAVMIQ